MTNPDRITLEYESPDGVARRKAEDRWNRPLPGGPERTLETKWVALALCVLGLLAVAMYLGLLVFAAAWTPQ